MASNPAIASRLQSWRPAGRVAELGSLDEVASRDMTVAVCLKCGAMKHGAWTPCPKCKHTPEDPEDKAKHVMTSDHYFSKADLEGISARVQSGLPLQFDPNQIEQFVATFKTMKSPKRSVRLFMFSFFAILVSVIVGSVYLIVKFLLR